MLHLGVFFVFALVCVWRISPGRESIYLQSVLFEEFQKNKGKISEYIQTTSTPTNRMCDVIIEVFVCGWFM